VIARLTAIYLAIFGVVLVALSTAAYIFVGMSYRSLLQPALQTPEGQSAYAHAMSRVALAIGGFDLPLLVIVGGAAYILARTSLRPLIEARERERNFSIDVAHELRSPLATIASVSQAARAQAGPDMRPRLDTIAHAALDAASLIGDLLTLARDPRPAVLQREPVDLANVAIACGREFEDRFRERGIALSVVTESSIIEGDERRLRELVRNLLDNALRHAKSQTRVSTAVQRNLASIVVEDDGPGIPATERDRVFERFYRRNGDAGGVGVGLAIVQWIARAHDGTVHVNAGSDGGTAFVASFPTMRL
jgi:signal transduction histidine kinase